MKALLLFIILYARLAFTQVSGCQEDSDCDSNAYCDVISFQCHPCLNCRDINREPGSLVSGCIKSVVRCGECFDGLAEDPSGDVTAPCVSPSSPSSTPPYVWVIISVSLLVVLMLAICVYVYRHTDTLKLITSSRTLVRGGPTPDISPPPPYNPTSPPHSFTNDDILVTGRPFVKVDDNGVGNNDRVRDSNQEARPFSNPTWVRGPELPPSYDAALSDETPTSVVTIDDENTMESLWTPNQDENAHWNTPISSEPASSPVPANELSSLLNEARETRLVRPPRSELDDMQPTPNKMICIRQDTNNNGNSRNRDAGEGTSSSTSVPSLTFNITVQQHNDLKLIST